MATLVLLVEDEPEIRELFKFSLTRAGFRFTEAESAVQQLLNQLPVRHPGPDGPRYERHRPCQVHSERRNDEFPATDDVDRAQQWGRCS